MIQLIAPLAIGQKIADVAKSYIGQTEIPGNKGFTNKEFQKKMEAVGWKMTYAWCAFFGELVWKEAYGQSMFATLDKLFSPSALSTYYNFAGHENWPVKQTPAIGACAVYKHGIDPKKWEGHFGIVTAIDVTNKTTTNVEGNTNDKGGREGYIVSQKVRSYQKTVRPNGLNILGFIHPI